MDTDTSDAGQVEPVLAEEGKRRCPRSKTPKQKRRIVFNAPTTLTQQNTARCANLRSGKLGNKNPQQNSSWTAADGAVEALYGLEQRRDRYIEPA